METVRMKPDSALKTYWTVIWIIWYAILLFVAVLPAIIMAIEGERGPGILIAGIMIASWSVVMFPLLAWLPAFYNTLEYEVDEDSVNAKRGVFWKRYVTVPFAKITNIDVHQGPLERRFGLGTIHVQTAGAGGQQGGAAELRLAGIRDIHGVKELIAERVKRHSRSMGGAPAAAGGSDSEILNKILIELGAIRETLERSAE